MENATAGACGDLGREPGRLPPRPEGRGLRVGMLASLFPPSIGGIQSHTLRLGQKLVERGVDVHVVTRQRRGLAAFERMGGVRVHRVGLATADGAAGSVAYVAGSVRAVLRLAPQLDLLHAHQLLSPATAGLLAAPLAGLPLIVNPHACGAIGDVGVLGRTAVGRLRLAAVVRRADAFVAVSRTIADELVGAGAPARAVWGISNGVDTDRFAPAQAAERRALRRALGFDDAPLVVYTGRLAPEKGVDLLLAGWSRLPRGPGAPRLCVVGEGPEAPQLRAQARALGIGGTVTFAGGVPDVAPYLRAADAAVLPSRTEGMPVALLEALSCALPAVATRVGGSAEVLGGTAAGWLVPAEDPAALAAALEAVLGDRERAARIGQAGRGLVLERYAMDRVVDRFLDLYRTVLERRRAAADRAGRGARRWALR